MKKKYRPYVRLMFAIFGAIALSILFFFIVFRIEDIGAALAFAGDVAMPFILGAVIAFILTPICNFFERHLCHAFKGKRGPLVARVLSVIITLVLAFAIIAGLIAFVVPAVISSVESLIQNIPSYIQSFMSYFEGLAKNNEFIADIVSTITSASSSAGDNLSDFIEKFITPNLNSISGLVVRIEEGIEGVVHTIYNVIVGIIASIYFLWGRRTLARQAKKILYSIFKTSWADAILEETRFANAMFSAFLCGRLICSLIVGAVAFIILLIMGIPHAILIAVIVGVTNIIPVFGPIVGAVISFVLVLFANPLMAVIFLILLIVLFQVDGMILTPRIVGKETKLSGLWILFSVIFFGGLWGFIGMIIGVPLFATIYDIVRKLVDKGLAYRKRQVEAAEQDQDSEGGQVEESPEQQLCGTLHGESGKNDNQNDVATSNLNGYGDVSQNSDGEK